MPFGKNSERARRKLWLVPVATTLPFETSSSFTLAPPRPSPLTWPTPITVKAMARAQVSSGHVEDRVSAERPGAKRAELLDHIPVLKRVPVYCRGVSMDCTHRSAESIA